MTENSSLLNQKMKLNLLKCKSAFKNRSLLVDLLAILFGIGSWIGVNSLYVQLPVLVSTAPEGWNLPSYLVVIIQLANIGPITYTLVQKFSTKNIRVSLIIYAVLITGSVAAVLLASFYQETAFFWGEERSIALLSLAFFLALVGCTSSVLFMPYMGRFRDIYLITYLIGEGLSGFLPSIVTLFQGVGGNPECIPNNSTDGPAYDRYQSPPRFGSDIFFYFTFSMLVVSTIAFGLLNKLKQCKREYAPVTIKNGNDYDYNSDKNPDDNKKEITKILSPFNYKYLMILMAGICMFGNGVFPSIQSFSCLPYGNTAYHLTVTLSSIANPIACFLAVFLPHKSISSITYLSLTTAAIACYTMATAVMSPNPPLVGTDTGTALVVSRFIYTFFF